LRWLAALALAAACGGAFAQRESQFHPDFKAEDLYRGTSEDPRDWKEGQFRLPAYPQPDGLIEFQVSALTGFRFFIDPASLSSSPEGVVRFTLVSRSRSGTENVSYDGLRCKTDEQRTYATGRVAEKAWYPVSDSKWKPLQVKTVTRQYLVLARDFFCPAKVPIASREEGVDALRQGIHPHALSNNPDYLRK